MNIWVDADACPMVIKEILYRAAERKQVPLILVANQTLRVPPSKFIRSVRVESGFDVADNEIAERCEAGDLVITADIPLAADVIKKGGQALSPRGELYTRKYRRACNMRDFMDTMRSGGEHTEVLLYTAINGIWQSTRPNIDAAHSIIEFRWY